MALGHPVDAGSQAMPRQAASRIWFVAGRYDAHLTLDLKEKLSAMSIRRVPVR